MLLLLSSDPSLNPHNLIPVFRAITGRWDKIVYLVVVPDARAKLFRQKFSVRDQLTEAAATYYALYHHDPNWKELSRRLYRAGETLAVQIARPHLQTVTGTCIYSVCNACIHIYSVHVKMYMYILSI